MLDLGEYYQNIGEILLCEVQDSSKCLIFSEVGDGYIITGIFFLLGEIVQFRYGSDELRDTIQDFWGKWRLGAPEWRVMVYKLQNETFDVEFLYPHQISDNEVMGGSRDKIVSAFFGDVEIDYSSPE